MRGLNAGADDYLTKPFSRVELLARLQAIRRRQVATARPPGDRLRRRTAPGRLRAPAGHPGRAPGGAHPHRVPPAGRPGAPRRPGPLVRPADRAGLGRPQRTWPRPASSTRSCGCGASSAGTSGDDSPLETVRGLRLPLPDRRRRGDRELPASSTRGVAQPSPPRSPCLAHPGAPDPSTAGAERPARRLSTGSCGSAPAGLRAGRPWARCSSASSRSPTDARRRSRWPASLFFVLVDAAFAGALGAAARLGAGRHPHRLHRRHRPRPRRPGRRRLGTGRPSTSCPIVWLALYGRRSHLVIGLVCVDAGPGSFRSSIVGSPPEYPPLEWRQVVTMVGHHPGRLHRSSPWSSRDRAYVARPGRPVPVLARRTPASDLRPRPPRDAAAGRHRDRHHRRRPRGHGHLLLGRRRADARLPGGRGRRAAPSPTSSIRPRSTNDA